jgi:dihydrofolate reductase
MRRIVSNFFISLDGVVEAPDQWHFPYFDEELGQVVQAGMSSATSMLLGRRGYDEWAAYWPNQPADDEIAAYMNGAHKIVLTHRPLDEPVWANTTAIGGGGDTAAEVRALKEDGEGDIGMSGSATAVRWLLAEGLLDELNLLVHPLAVGRGARLFPDGAAAKLALTSSAALSSGIVHLRYAPAS